MLKTRRAYAFVVSWGYVVGSVDFLNFSQTARAILLFLISNQTGYILKVSFTWDLERCDKNSLPGIQ